MLKHLMRRTWLFSAIFLPLMGLIFLLATKAEARIELKGNMLERYWMMGDLEALVGKGYFALEKEDGKWVLEVRTPYTGKYPETFAIINEIAQKSEIVVIQRTIRPKDETIDL